MFDLIHTKKYSPHLVIKHKGILPSAKTHHGNVSTKAYMSILLLNQIWPFGLPKLHPLIHQWLTGHTKHVDRLVDVYLCVYIYILILFSLIN